MTDINVKKLHKDITYVSKALRVGIARMLDPLQIDYEVKEKYDFDKLYVLYENLEKLEKGKRGNKVMELERLDKLKFIYKEIAGKIDPLTLELFISARYVCDNITERPNFHPEISV